MKASRKSASNKLAQPVLLTFYEVNEYRTITDPSVREPKLRSDVFGNVSPALIHSTDQLIDEVRDCSPLSYHFSRLADDHLSEIEQELEDDDTSLSLTARRRLAFLAAKLRDDPETGWKDWVAHEGDPGLASFKEHIQDWLDEGINWHEYEDFDSGWCGQSASLRFFSSLEDAVCEALGVVIIEGEHPGSSYYAAELRDDIAQANEAAQTLGLNFRFRAEGVVAPAAQAMGTVASNEGVSS
jgi:hypothetical protein